MPLDDGATSGVFPAELLLGDPLRRLLSRPTRRALGSPHLAVEHRQLALTAGFCEELLYRGYLVWCVAPWLGQLGGMAAIVLAFGVSHAYQGRKGAMRATLAGLVMAVIVLTSGSLIPAMIVHALIDIGGGTVGYLLQREEAPVTQAAQAAA